MDLTALAKFLTERQRYLWPLFLLAALLLAARGLGHLDQLQDSIVTATILGGLFAGLLLITIAVECALQAFRPQASLYLLKRRDAEAIRNFRKVDGIQSDILRYAMCNIRSQHFRAPHPNARLAEMMGLKVIERSGTYDPNTGFAMYKVRNHVWHIMKDEHWERRDPIPDELGEPWKTSYWG